MDSGNPEQNMNAETVPVQIKTKEELFMAYMPFIKDGGLFVRTTTPFQLGDEIILMLKLIDEPEKFSINGRVVWITPVGAQGGKPAGIGVQFTAQNSETICKKIEVYLSTMDIHQGGSDTM